MKTEVQDNVEAVWCFVAVIRQKLAKHTTAFALWMLLLSACIAAVACCTLSVAGVLLQSI